MNQKFLEDFIYKIEEKRMQHCTRLTSGVISSMEEYKFISGKLLGINECVDILREMSSNFFGKNLGIENGKIYIIS
jgi:hypothetical protein